MKGFAAIFLTLTMLLAFAPPTLAAGAPITGLIAHYSFAQKPADGVTVVNNVSGSVASALVQNPSGAAWEDNALVFSGEGTSNSASGTWVSLPNEILGGAKSATISVELKADASMLNNYHFVWNIGNSGTDTYWFLNMKTPRTTIKYGGSEKSANSPFSAKADRWYNITSVIDSEAHTIALYVDGEKVAVTSDSALSLSQVSDQSRNTIGRAPYNDPMFKGAVSSFRVYNRALDASEVQQLSDADAALHSEYFASLARSVADSLEDVTLADDKSTLPDHDGTVTWHSSSDAVSIAEDGITAEAKRPAQGEAPITGKLTATVNVRGQIILKEVNFTVKPQPAPNDPYGYMMVHFIEDSAGYAEKIYLDISRGDNPRQWDPLNGGNPILVSELGTTGSRDPFLTYNPETGVYYVLATDLRVFGGDGAGWDGTNGWNRKGSTKMNIWESRDLVTWSKARQFDVTLDKNGTPKAQLGMMWAPEATWVSDYYGEGRGAFIVYWSSQPFELTDTDHTGSTTHKIMWGATTDFTQDTYEYGGVFLEDSKNGWIDTTLIQNGDKTYHITKSFGEQIIMESTTAKEWWKTGTAWTRIQSHIGESRFGSVEGPAVFKSHSEENKWYLFVDDLPTPGYMPMVTSNLDNGWDYLDAPDYFLTENTKHGGVISLTSAQYNHIRECDAKSLASKSPDSVRVAVGASTADILSALPKSLSANLYYDMGVKDCPVDWDLSGVDTSISGAYPVLGTLRTIGANHNQWVGKNGSVEWTAEDKKTYSSTALTTVTYVLVGDTPDSAPYSIEVDTAGKGVDINQSLFGLFLEDINYAVDGGMYPELVQNKSFEYRKFKSIWEQEYLDESARYAWQDFARGGSVSTVLKSDTPIHENNPNYLEITALNPEDGVGVMNIGFSDESAFSPGMEIVQNDTYSFSLFAKSESYRGDIKIELASADGSEIYASALLNGVESEWKKLECTLTPNASSSTARLHVLMAESGTLDIDMVSLFPQRTFKNRENGIRPDIGQLLADMKPAFLRFPGGCVVEGLTIDNRYKWKDTVGPLEKRKSNFNNWGFAANSNFYNQSYGFGFYEFFRLAEDLGAMALPCVNAGCSHQGTVTPMTEMAEIAQDVIDLIDFAIGTDMTNEWTRLRADMGHSEPFDMKYVEIGNENTDDNYFARYAFIAQKVRAVHPEIKLIVGGGFGMNDATSVRSWQGIIGGSIDADAVDEHYYVPNSKFYESMNFYDNYERGKGGVFIGEFASKDSTNAIESALAEASYMTHVEENGDVVELAAYAPLLAKKNNTQWTPDLIYFDNDSSFGSTNYFIQKLYMRNLGDITLPSELIASGDESYRIKGAIGLGSYNTAVQYDDVKITDDDTAQTLFEDDFSSASDKWSASKGTWSLSGGVYAQTNSSATNTLACTPDIDAENYTVTMRAKKVSGSEGFLIHLGVKGTDTFIRLNLGGWGNTQSAFQKWEGGVGQLMTPYYDKSRFPSVSTNVWYDIKFVVRHNRVKCYINGTLEFDLLDCPRKGPVYTVSTKDSESGDIIVKIVNPQPSSQRIMLNLKNAQYINPTALKTTLSATDASARNSFEAPNAVTPTVSRMEDFGESSILTLDAYSFTLLRIKTTQEDFPIPLSAAISASRIAVGSSDTVRISLDSLTMSDASDADTGDAEISFVCDGSSAASIDKYGKLEIGESAALGESVTVYAIVTKNGESVKSNEIVLPVVIETEDFRVISFAENNLSYESRVDAVLYYSSISPVGVLETVKSVPLPIGSGNVQLESGYDKIFVWQKESIKPLWIK